ncbi:MAG: glycosyltransferase family 4 protein [Candidatus Desulfofervidaceae bacterium]|nr:glycosyltransferase family 4 protein [Candidatus Desulfofervidaceae bacterium]
MGKAYHKRLEEQVNLGIELYLITPPRWGNTPLEIKPEEIRSYKVYPLPTVLDGKNHFYFFKVNIRDYIKTIKPDLIHIHEEPWSLVTYQCLRANKKFNVPTIGFTWQNIYKKYPFPFSYFEKYAYKNMKGIIAGNREAEEVLRKKGYKGPTEIIPEVGVDEGVFKPIDDTKLRESLGLNGKFIIGYFGRFVVEKGIYLLLEAFKKLLKDFKNIRLLLVGSGPERGNIINFVNSHNLRDFVIVLDQIKTTDVPRYMNLLDILVLPSFEYRGRFWKGWKEQFGRVLIEAMACEVPVIGSNSGEIPYVIGDAGLVFKEKNVEDLWRKLKILILNDELRNELKRKGRESFEKIYPNHNC